MSNYITELSCYITWLCIHIIDNCCVKCLKNCHVVLLQRQRLKYLLWVGFRINGHSYFCQFSMYSLFSDFFGQQTDWSLPGILDAPDFSRLTYGDYTPYQNTMEMKPTMNSFTCQASSQSLTSPTVSAGSSGILTARKRKCPSVE